MKSVSSAPYSMLAALSLAATYGRAATPWTPSEEDPGDQRRFLDEWYERGVGDVAKLGEAIQAIASLDRHEINAWLAGKGYDIRLEQPFPPEAYGTAAVMDVLVMWAFAGEEGKIYAANENSGLPYDAIRWESNDGLQFFETAERAPVVSIKISDTERVFVTPHPVFEGDTRELLRQVEQIEKSMTARPDLHKGLVLPMLSLDDKPKMDFIKGLWFLDDGGEREVFEAKQQNRLKVNPKGARAQSAAAVAIRTRSMSIGRRPVVIDQPFFIWFRRDDLALPYFAAFAAKDSWKNPGRIED